MLTLMSVLLMVVAIVAMTAHIGSIRMQLAEKQAELEALRNAPQRTSVVLTLGIWALMPGAEAAVIDCGKRAAIAVIKFPLDGGTFAVAEDGSVFVYALGWQRLTAARMVRFNAAVDAYAAAAVSGSAQATTVTTNTKADWWVSKQNPAFVSGKAISVFSHWTDESNAALKGALSLTLPPTHKWENDPATSEWRIVKK